MQPEHLDIVFLIYGLAFLAMGLAITLRYDFESEIALASVLGLLAGFGYTHGLLEWTDLWRVVRGDTPALAAVRPFLLLASYLLLFEFGRRLLGLALAPESAVRRLLSPGLYLLLGVGLAAGVAITPAPFGEALALWSRYLVGFPGSLFAGGGFLLYYRHALRPALAATDLARIRLASHAAGVTFLTYAVLGGLVTPRADLFPARWVNYETFYALFGVPVQLLRATCAVVAAAAVSALLRVFHLDRTRRLQEALATTSRALAELHRLSRRNQLILDSTSEGVFGVDEAGRVLFVNDAALRMLGFDRDGLMGQSIAALICPPADAGASCDGNVCELHLTPQHPVQRQSGDGCFRRRDGSTFPVEYESAPMGTDANQTGAVVVFRDISERRRQEADSVLAREGAETKFAVASILQSPDLDLAQRCGEALERVFDMRGLEVERRGGIFLVEPDGRHLALFVTRGAFPPGFQQREAYLPLGHCLCGRAAEHGELMVLDSCFQNPPHEVQWPGMPQHGHYVTPMIADHVTLGVLFLYTRPYPSRSPIRLDVLRQLGDLFASAIQRERTRRAIIEAKLKAESANRAKSAFLANMSHELRTPLNAMLGYAQILQRDAALGPAQRHAVDTIRRSGDHLLTLINDILDLAKVEAGRFELLPGPCDLAALLRGQEELFRIRAAEKGIEFHCTAVADLPARIEADEKRLRQVIMNLLANAVKFTERGEVRLECRALPADDHHPERLRIEVSDTGIGIAPERIPHLFKPFSQEGDAEYRSQGTGLGLAISKGLIDQMGGELQIESALGEGSRLVVLIPLRRVHVAPTPAATREVNLVRGYRRLDNSLHPLRILVVDDLIDNRAVLRALLEPLGFAVQEAADGEAALAALLADPSDLVLVDLVMPGINGLETTRRILALPGLSSLPVLACSASAFREDRIHSLEAGCREHLGKPVRLDDLLAALGRQLPLEWVYEPLTAPAPAPDDGRRLSAEQRGVLLRLVRSGNVRGLQQSLAACNETGDPLLAPLRAAAARFDLRSVRVLLETQEGH